MYKTNPPRQGEARGRKQLTHQYRAREYILNENTEYKNIKSKVKHRTCPLGDPEHIGPCSAGVMQDSR